jgi:hypothetical protein
VHDDDELFGPVVDALVDESEFELLSDLLRESEFELSWEVLLSLSLSSSLRLSFSDIRSSKASLMPSISSPCQEIN